METDLTLDREMAALGLRGQVGQLFIVRPEALEPAIRYAEDSELPPYRLQSVSEGMRRRAEEYPVGGVLLFGHNILDEKQLERFTKGLRALPGAPLLCMDEEGGRVSRIAGNPAFDVTVYESLAAVGASGNPQRSYEAGFSIGTYLHRYGIEVDFAPVADVNTNPENIVIGSRAFSDKPAAAAPMVAAFVRGLSDAGVTGCLKHFPGHGDTRTDTHFGFASTGKTWAQMLDCEMLSFRAGIAAGASLVMAAHIAAPAVTGNDLPATMSPALLQDKLRGELGFEGLVVTDALEMHAVSRRFSNADAAVRAFLAGADILLCPQNLQEAFEGVLRAVEDGSIPRGRLESSVRRILALKRKIRSHQASLDSVKNPYICGL